MKKKMTSILAAGAIASLAAFPDMTKANDDEANIRVMTYNVYIGADIFQLLGAGSPEEVPIVAAQVFSDIQTTDFFQRAESIADIIAKKRPHFVGLQEVSIIRTQCPADFLPLPNASDVFAGYLEILQNALDARGARYDVVTSVVNVDAELPVLNVPQILSGCPAPCFDARVTDRDVTLKRRDVTAYEVFQTNYTAALPVSVGGGTAEILFLRGFTVVDARIDGRPYRITNTHLEPGGNVFGNLIQSAQAFELTQTLNALEVLLGSRTQFVLGDFNSSPDAFTSDCILSGVVVPDGCVTPYAMMVNNGYADAWNLRENGWKPGFTCCQAPLLDSDKSALDARIDHVWHRAPLSRPTSQPEIDEVKANVVGAKVKSKTVDGRWPSDHAGVFARFELEFDEEDDDSDSD